MSRASIVPPPRKAAETRSRPRPARRASGEWRDADERIRHMLNDPAASRWLRNALRAALDRDPVDAANDAEILGEVLNARAEAVLKSARAAPECRTGAKP